MSEVGSALRPQTVLYLDVPRSSVLQERRRTQSACPEMTAGGNNGHGIQSKGGRAGNEGRKRHVEVMLAAQVITTPKPLSNGKGQLIHSLLLYSFPR